MSDSAVPVPATVLIDDCQDHCLVVEYALRMANAGGEVISIYSGESAMVRLAEMDPAPGLVVMDWCMPDVSGADVLRWAREQPHLRDTRFVILSGSTAGEDRARALQLGASAWETKPVGPRAYEQLAARLVGGPVAVGRRVEVSVPAAAAPGHERTRGQAHDIRNQVSAIMGFCDLLAAADHPGGGAVGAGRVSPGLLLPGFSAVEQARKAARYVGCIRDAARRCGEIAGVMMDHAPSVEQTLVDLNALLQEEVATVATELIRAGINVQVQRGEGLPRVRVDPLEIGRVVANLAGNARDAFMEARAAIVDARIVFATARASAREVLLTVADNGPGMAPALQERVWDPGFSTKGAAVARRGYGLAVVRSSIENAGGRIELESEPGRGTAFRLFLPASAD